MKHRDNEKPTGASEIKHVFAPIINGVHSAYGYVLELARCGKLASNKTEQEWRDANQREEKHASPTSPGRSPECHIELQTDCESRPNEFRHRRAEKLRSKSERLMQTREQVQLGRHQAFYERHNLVHQLDLFDKSLQGMPIALQSATAPEAGHNPFANKPDPVTAFQTDMRSRISDIRQRQSVLTELEDDLAQKEQEFVTAAERLRADLLGVHAAHGSESSNSDAGGSRPPSETPSLLTRYLDRKGDIGVFRERLSNVDYEYNERRHLREVQRDRDEYLEQSDQDFENKHFVERQEILRDLHLAEQETETLQFECEQHGLDTSFRPRRSSESTDDEASAKDYVVVPRVNDWVQHVPLPHELITNDMREDSMDPTSHTPFSTVSQPLDDADARGLEVQNNDVFGLQHR